MSGAYDTLFKTGTSLSKSWWKTAPVEHREWVTGLAAKIVELDREPTTWAEVHATFVELFGDGPSETTLRKWTRLEAERLRG